LTPGGLGAGSLTVPAGLIGYIAPKYFII